MLRMEARLVQTVELEQELSSEDKEGLRKAAEFWATKPHISTEIPMSALRGLLTHQKVPEDTKGLVQDEGTLKEDFVELSEAEMVEIMLDEKFGILLGEGIFISEAVPDEYLSFVMLNLAVNRRLHDDARMIAMFEGVGADTATARHWSANLIDVLAAEKFFDKDRAAFLEYLKWRKGVERTDFFENNLLKKYFDTELLQLQYRRTTHPKDRGRRVAASWALSGLAAQDTRMEKVVLDLGVSKADLLFRKLQQIDTFNPGKMVELLDLIILHVRPKSGTRNDFQKRRVINLIDYPELNRQAYLLTEDIASDGAILELAPNGEDVFLAKPYASATCDALKDRIAFFAGRQIRRQILEAPVRASLLRLLKESATLQLGGLANTTMEIDIANPDQRIQAEKWIAVQIEAIDEELIKVNKLLERYVELEAHMNGVGPGIKVIPGTVEEKKQELLVHQKALVVKRGELESTKEFLARVEEMRTSQQALLAATVLEDDTAKS